MEAIILAAGVGSRLAPLTNEFPKSLVEVNSKPIIQYQLESYLEAGINKINIVVGYKGEKIEGFIEQKYGKQKGLINIIWNHDYAKTNNMYSLFLALKEIKATGFILSNADVVIKKDMVKKILNNNIESGIAYQSKNYNDESMKVSIDGHNYITHISKQILEVNSAGTSIDFYKVAGEAKESLENEIYRTIKEKKDLNSWTEVAIDNILKYKFFKGIDIGNEFWYEIDNHEDLRNAELGLA
jgi:choline kinase